MRNAIKVVNKSVITDNFNSISIFDVCRYCSRLPGDGFTHIGPKCDVITTENNGFYCILQLPINSHVRHPIKVFCCHIIHLTNYPVIKGVVMDTALKAQQVVAVEACKQLHQAGELDDDLNSIGKMWYKLTNGN